MMKQRTHNEWFMPIRKTTCPCGQKKTQVFAWGEYAAAKWRTVEHFCQACFEDRVLARLVAHAGDCGCDFALCARTGHGPLPGWLRLPELCGSMALTGFDEKPLGIGYMQGRGAA